MEAIITHFRGGALRSKFPPNRNWYLKGTYHNKLRIMVFICLQLRTIGWSGCFFLTEGSWRCFVLFFLSSSLPFFPSIAGVGVLIPERALFFFRNRCIIFLWRLIKMSFSEIESGTSEGYPAPPPPVTPPASLSHALTGLDIQLMLLNHDNFCMSVCLYVCSCLEYVCYQ